MFSKTARQLSKSTAYKIPAKYKQPDILQRPGVGVDSIWIEFVGLTNKYKALNLGQGFPNFSPPEHVMGNLCKIVGPDGNLLMNQYTRGLGHPSLVAALAKMYSPILNKELDPNTNIIVNSGAYACLYNAIFATVQPGDEVIIVEPYFDCYAPMVRMAGGIPKFITLSPESGKDAGDSSNWSLDMNKLEGLFTDKTKAFIINNPNNPLGKVFTQDELKSISDLIIKNDVICISDEVYEHIVYDDNKMHRIANIPGMWDRTFTIGSAGKTFSVTGWKLGWTVAPDYLIKNMGYFWQNIVYTCPTLTQEAVAQSFQIEMDLMEKDPESCYFINFAKYMQPKRTQMASILESIGLKPVVPQGGYFMAANAENLKVDIPDDFYDDSVPWDHNLARWLIKDKGLSTIPNSAFYNPEHQRIDGNDKNLRFCFAKDDATFETAEKVMKKNFS